MGRLAVTTFHLIRHASNDFLGRALAGRLPDVHLNAQGKAEAERLPEYFRGRSVHRLFSSPMERCRETAEPLARKLGLSVEIVEALNEVDFGEWKGASMAALDKDPRWQRWNSFRGGHTTPGGENMTAIQMRMVTAMIQWRDSFPGNEIAVVSHGDPIRAALCFWLGMPIEFIHRLDIDPGSISTMDIGDEGAVVRCLNVKPVQG